MSAEIACHDCDLLVEIGDLKDGESAACPRCGSFLTRYRHDAYERVVAYSVASLVLLVLANAYPFLSFGASGMESEITLWQTPGALWENDLPGIAIMVGAFIIGIPGLILLLTLALCLPLSHRRRQPWLVMAAKGVFLMQNWAMVEVFIIGVIVALVKIAAMADVALGISFWAYAGFTISFTLAVIGLDRYQCWRDIEALGQCA